MVTDDDTTGGAHDITLRDVIAHMVHMEQRLTALIQKNTDTIRALTLRVDSLSGRVDSLEARIDRLEVNLTASIEALDVDLASTMKDTLKIRQHVGMAVPDDE